MSRTHECRGDVDPKRTGLIGHRYTSSEPCGHESGSESEDEHVSVASLEEESYGKGSVGLGSGRE
jgi:hypothetical protein